MNIKEFFKGWTKLDFVWLLIANVIMLGLSIRNGDTAISMVCAVTGIVSVIFASKQMTSNYVVGLINVVLYAYLSYEAKLYGDFQLNAFFYVPMQFIGYYMWNKAKNKSIDHIVEAKRLTGEQAIFIAVGTIATILVYAKILDMLKGNITLIDSASTVLSVVAMILMVKQYTEQWYMWVLVNIVSIIMWAVSLSQGTGDLATLLMWCVFLINSIFGLVNWRKASKDV